MRRTEPARLIRAVVATAALAVLLAGCGAGDDDPGQDAASPSPEEAAAAGPPRTEDREVTVQGRQRTYRLQPPPGEEAAPVVVAIHDAGNDVDGMVQVTQLDRAAAQGGFAVAFPAAVEEAERTWNAEFCCGSGPSVGVDDMRFLDAVIDELSGDERIDADRIYLAGVSNGAVMAYRYACERSERIAAVASVAGTMDPDTCEPEEAVSVLEIRGTADEVVPFDGGDMPDFVQATRPAMSADALAARWAELNACADEPDTATDPPVTRKTWEECDADATVELIGIEGAGHTWYASEFGPVDGAVDATGEMLRFFELD